VYVAYWKEAIRAEKTMCHEIVNGLLFYVQRKALRCCRGSRIAAGKILLARLGYSPVTGLKIAFERLAADMVIANRSADPNP